MSNTAFPYSSCLFHFAVKRFLFPFFLFFFCLKFPSDVKAQFYNEYNKTYFSVDIGPKWDLYRLSDSGNQLKNDPVFLFPSIGIVYGKEFSKTFAAEFGVYIIQQGQKTDFERVANEPTLNGPFAIQVPIRLYLTLIDFTRTTQLRLNGAIIGALNGNASTRNQSQEFESIIENRELVGSVNFLVSEIYSSSTFYSLGEVGATVEQRLSPTLGMYAGIRFVGGFSEIYRKDVLYEFNGQSQQRATFRGNGTYVYVPFGIRFLFDN